MKKGFTLIELLAVIVILAIIAVIAVPIVINIIEDSKDNANKISIDMYARAVENAVARYQLNEGKIPNNYEEVKKYIEYSGSEVICDDFKIHSDGTIYLNQCKVDGKFVNYSIGNIIGKGTLAYDILSKNGGVEAATIINTEWTEGTPATATYHRVYKTLSHWYGTAYDFDKETGKYKLSGDLVQATLAECRAGQKSDGTSITCGEYTLGTGEITYGSTTIYKITSFTNEEKADENSYLYMTTQTIKAQNGFSAEITASDAGLHKTQDDLGDSYYFRGAPTNNYVKFGTYAKDTTITASGIFDNNWEEWTINVKAGTPMYWRIVRINGDGTIRLVYDGTQKKVNGTFHTVTVSKSYFNDYRDGEEYVGYTYDKSYKDTTQVDSTIKGVVDKWYVDHLEKNYGSYIADEIFCNDREVTKYEYYRAPETEEEYNKYGDYVPVKTEEEADRVGKYYGAYSRVYDNKKPSLKCAQKSDRYTVNDTENGNGLLTYPVGLITADEVLMAGLGTQSYLHTESIYWTSSPAYIVWQSGISEMYAIFENGKIYETPPDDMLYNVRPVINLKANVKFTGDGSFETPYQIIME